jgi:hypothetical protein
MNFRLRLFLVGGLLIFLAACTSSAGAPEFVIENYLTALVEGDNVRSANLSCADWEETARAEGASFEGVEVVLEDMACRTISENGTSAVVSCDGAFVFSYAGGEDEIRPLDVTNYVLRFESGEWRMCGYE